MFQRVRDRCQYIYIQYFVFLFVVFPCVFPGRTPIPPEEKETVPVIVGMIMNLKRGHICSGSSFVFKYMV